MRNLTVAEARARAAAVRVSSYDVALDLTQGPITRTLIAFTLPTLGSNVLQSLNASVNAVWVGHYLGEAPLTAATIM